MVHDFEKQRLETVWVWSDIVSRNPDLASNINLDIHFLPVSNSANKDKFKASLEEVGFLVEFYKEDETVEVSVSNIAASVEAVWLYEERATKLALSHGFKPDGWGFFSN